MPYDYRRHQKCLDEFGLSYGALCGLVAVVARWRCYEEATSYVDIEAFIEREEGLTRSDHFKELEGLRLIRRERKARSRVYFRPTQAGFGRVGWAHREFYKESAA